MPWDNAGAIGIVNNTVKRKRSRSMEMRFFGWEARKHRRCSKFYGTRDLKIVQITKANSTRDHTRLQSGLTTYNSPRILPRALRPSTLKGCVGTLDGGYVRNIPLPRVPQVQSASLVTSTSCKTMDSAIDSCYSQVPCVPTWSDLARSLAGLGRNILSCSPVWLM
jgi:hypothetical protein